MSNPQTTEFSTSLENKPVSVTNFFVDEAIKALALDFQEANLLKQNYADILPHASEILPVYTPDTLLVRASELAIHQNIALLLASLLPLSKYEGTLNLKTTTDLKTGDITYIFSKKRDKMLFNLYIASHKEIFREITSTIAYSDGCHNPNSQPLFDIIRQFQNVCSDMPSSWYELLDLGGEKIKRIIDKVAALPGEYRVCTDQSTGLRIYTAKHPNKDNTFLMFAFRSNGIGGNYDYIFSLVSRDDQKQEPQMVAVVGLETLRLFNVNYLVIDSFSHLSENELVFLGNVLQTNACLNEKETKDALQWLLWGKIQHWFRKGEN